MIVRKDWRVESMMEAVSNEEVYRVALDIIPTPALILDRELTIVACNVAYERATHVKRAAMLGRPVFEVFPGSDDHQTSILRNSYERVLNSGKPHHIPYIQYATTVPDNPGLQERHWTVSNIPLSLRNGTLFGLLHCPTDITELTQLRQANQRIGAVELDSGTQENIER